MLTLRGQEEETRLRNHDRDDAGLSGIELLDTIVHRITHRAYRIAVIGAVRRRGESKSLDLEYQFRRDESMHCHQR